MSLKYTTLTILLVATILVTGCAGSFAEKTDQDEDQTTPEAGETETGLEPAVPSKTPDRSEQRPAQTPPPGLERVEITTLEPVAGEVPTEIMEQIIADLVERIGTEAREITVTKAEAVVWNDGSLGCPKPGEFYIQMLINGYWVVLEVEGIEYDYRVSDKGSFKLCEGASVVPINPPEADNQNPLVLQAKEDLAGRLGIAISEIELLSFEEVVWPDSSLGCPQPGMRYKQVPYDGALIRLSAGGQIYDYHNGGSRGVFLCEQSIQANKKSSAN